MQQIIKSTHIEEITFKCEKSELAVILEIVLEQSWLEAIHRCISNSQGLELISLVQEAHETQEISIVKCTIN